MNIYKLVANNYPLRVEQFEGRPHYVAPVVMMVEGVHNGSQGPVLHSEAELSRDPKQWDGTLVSIDHPQDSDGEYVSIKTAGFDDKVVGVVRNSRYENGLRGEVWLDVEKLQKTSQTAFNHVQTGHPLEVSLGMFTEPELTEGDWQGEHYSQIAHNYVPDHLALLPGEKGACSWEDGCGIRVNKESCECKTKAPVLNHLWVNQEGFRETMEKIQNKLNGMDTSISFHFLHEVFEDNTFVFEVRREGGESELFRQSFELNESGVDFTGNPEKVIERREFVSANKAKGGENMDKAKQIEALVANKATKWTEADREYLETLSEETLAKLEPVEVETPAPAQPVANAKVTKEAALEALREASQDEILAVLPADVRGSIEHGLELNAEHRAALISKITSNTEVYTAEELAECDTPALVKLSKAIKAPVSYIGKAGGASEGAPKVAPLLPPGVKAEASE